MCSHFPTCPSADRPDREAARIVALHPSQGWALLCNGVIVFDDAGEILPDGRAVPPPRREVPPPRREVAPPRRPVAPPRRPVRAPLAAAA